VPGAAITLACLLTAAPMDAQETRGPELNPTSTNFGQIRAVNNSVMRFFTFNTKFNF